MLDGYTNVDMASDIDFRKSIFEAEYIAITKASKEVL